MMHMRYLISFLSFLMLGFWGTAQAQQCNLPAPQNLTVQFIVPDQANFTWNPVAGAAGYRAVMTNLDNGSSTTQTLWGGNSTSSDFPVQPSTNYRIDVNAFCSANNHSPNVATTVFTAPAYIIVSEIIADRSINCSGMQRYTINVLGSKEIIPVVFDQGSTFQFECTYLPGGNGSPYLIRGEIERTEGQRATFANDINSTYELNGHEYRGDVCLKCFNYAKYNAPFDPNTKLVMNVSKGGYLYVETFGNGRYTNFKLTECTSGGGGTPGGSGAPGNANRNIATGANSEAFDLDRAQERTSETTTDHDIKVMPNPFETALTIDLGQGRHDFALIQMIDQSGRIVRTIQTTDQDRVTIPADDLSASLYFLKISTNTLPQRVIKVVKY